MKFISIVTYSAFRPVTSGVSSTKKTGPLDSARKGGATDSAKKDIKGKPNEDKEKINYLENKIDYLNNLVSEMKKQLEGKNALQRSNPPESDRTNDKIQFLNQTIAELKENNTRLSSEKMRLEADVQELLNEFSALKEKYEIEVDSKPSGNTGISPNQRLVDVHYLQELEAENKKLTEQQEFSERLEDIEKFKEGVAERDRKITNLQLQLEIYQVIKLPAVILIHNHAYSRKQGEVQMIKHYTMQLN